MSLESHYSAYHRKTVNVGASFSLLVMMELRKHCISSSNMLLSKNNANDSLSSTDIYLNRFAVSLLSDVLLTGTLGF